jgi:hypothetical protein
VNKCIEAARFYHITVGSAAIGISKIVRVVRRGEDDDGERGKPGIGSEPFQQVAAVLAAEIQIKQDQRGEA